MKAPFPYFGGKSTVAGEVWTRFGNVQNYVEPFAGSLAVMLARPHEPGIETVNDADGLLSNFWRALKHDPDAVAEYADWPVNEVDLHARHLWLVGHKEDITERLQGDPEWYEAKAAGWWVWGISCWIGGGWCSGEGPWHSVDGRMVNTGADGKGVQRRRPNLNSGQGVKRQNTDLIGYMNALANRLRKVRVCCGDWTRVCGPTPTINNGLTGIFLDPPYALDERDSVYANESDCADAVQVWAIENGNDPKMRIAICGYDSFKMPKGWNLFRWHANGGYSHIGNEDTRGKDNRKRECIWFNSSCLKPGLFDGLD